MLKTNKNDRFIMNIALKTFPASKNTINSLLTFKMSQKTMFRGPRLYKALGAGDKTYRDLCRASSHRDKDSKLPKKAAETADVR